MSDNKCEYFLIVTNIGRYCKAQECIHHQDYQKDLGEGLGKMCIFDGNLEKILANLDRKQKL